MDEVTCNIGVLIPALDPDNRLIELLEGLNATQSFSRQIVVVDDGTKNQAIFNQIGQTMSNSVIVLHHQHNEGKGAALKTGFNYLLQHIPNLTGIATMDSDGQHTVSDLCKCIELFNQHPQDMVIGCRSFSNDIPWRSRFGNILTNSIVRALTRLPVTDTQSGLRVIATRYVRHSLTFESQRYAFEFDMLLQAKKFGVTIYEQPIHTIYINDNAGSHFRVIRDSLSIYAQFVKFAFSGLISFGIDIGLFALAIHFFKSGSWGSVMFATILSRLVSSVANYLLNHHMVFGGKGETTFQKYLALMIAQMLLSGALTHMFGQAAAMIGHQTLVLTGVKMCVDFMLFMFSYQIQKRWIFVDGGAS